MVTDDQKLPTLARRNPLLPWLWVALIVLFIIAVLTKAALDRRGTTQFATFGLNHYEAVELQKSRYEQLQAFRQLAREKHLTLDDFETKFEFGKPTKVSPDGKRLSYEYPSPFTLHADVELRDDQSIRIRGFGHSGIRRQYSEHLMIEKAAVALSRIHGFSFIPWLGILIWAYVKPRQIGWASLVLAAWITFCSIVFLLVPNYTLTLRGLNSNDRLEFVVIMIIFGLPAMIWMLKRDVHDWWCCRNCDYDLHGISSDTCPECGCPIARETRSRLNAPSPDQS